MEYQPSDYCIVQVPFSPENVPSFLQKVCFEYNSQREVRSFLQLLGNYQSVAIVKISVQSQEDFVDSELTNDLKDAKSSRSRKSHFRESQYALSLVL